MCKLCKLLLCLSIYSIGMQLSIAAPVEVTLDRAYGYVIGDIVEAQVRIEANAGDKVLTESLPRLGRQNGWVDLLLVEQLPPTQEQVINLRFRYQWVNAPKEVTLAFLPAQKLKLVNAQQVSREVTIPAQAVSISPLSREEAINRTGFEAMRPEREVHALSVVGPQRRLHAYLIALGACLLLAGLLWWQRKQRLAMGPFAKAFKSIRALRPDATQVGMQLMHAAFDSTMNRAVFAQDIESFLQQRPQYRSLEHEIRQFYAASRDLFFGESASQSASSNASLKLLEFSKAMARVERKTAL